jgi:DNA-binding PadR family transcriptional regulator
MKMTMKFLSRQEELMLLSIWKLDDNAYGVTIRKNVTDLTDKYWSIGAVYDVLDRLTRKGLVSTVVGDPVKARGGKSKRFYRITKSGFKALEEVKTLQRKAWIDLPEPSFEKK